MQLPRADSFTAYLEEKQRLESSRSALPAARGSALTLLVVLAGAPGKRMPVAALHSASGMGFWDFSASLKRLRDAGYLQISGNPGKETVELSGFGAGVVELVQPQ
jgi:hypothetical protein